ncbi:aspartate racemase [Albidovulum inexpectatum]|uniref:Aspartate racemase n=1 Tax=Albidovulum inexpectatum TaxID=196587 RepID=A0A2S5JI53_9RHOB|nr:amino acid racemase [Albidovulum inexpectatum]PPB80955.1 aspartate racemase [Albidovulum inexpectatum]
MTAPRRIGILGGMGPEATVLLMQRLIRAVPARDDGDHIPLFVDMNPQVPSRIAALIEGTGPSPEPVLVAMARGLQQAGAMALAMPCNTAHHYAPAIRRAVTIPLIDMIELSVDAALRAAGPGATVGILASPAVRLTGVFDAALAARGLHAVHPDPQAQDGLLQAIRAIKRAGVTDTERQALDAARASVERSGARVSLVACTELSLAMEPAPPGGPLIDTLDALVGGIVAFALAPASPSSHASDAGCEV